MTNCRPAPARQAAATRRNPVALGIGVAHRNLRGIDIVDKPYPSRRAGNPFTEARASGSTGPPRREAEQVLPVGPDAATMTNGTTSTTAAIPGLTRSFELVGDCIDSLPAG